MARNSPESIALLIGFTAAAFGFFVIVSVFRSLRHRQLSREATTEIEGRVIDVVFKVNHQPAIPARRHAVIEVILPDGAKTTFEDQVELAHDAGAHGMSVVCYYDPVSGHLKTSGLESKRQPDAIPLRWQALLGFACIAGGLALTSYVIRHYGF